MVDTLLQTKLHMPPLHHDLVPRPRLIERLDEGSTRKLILISAPAGFGKTTLVAKWLDDLRPDDGEIENTQGALRRKSSLQNSQIAWVSLDEGDNGSTRFWSYVITALDRLQPGTGQNILDLMSTPQPPPLESTLTLLINDLMSVSGDWVLVLDDYHHIENVERDG